MKAIILLLIVALIIVPVFVGISESYGASAAVKLSVVLVHGAWADGSSWSRVVAHLQAAGYTVFVPPNPLRGLASDPAYVASFLASISGPIVLVGHSYGGAVITNTAVGNPNVKALVYVDAFAPDEGESIGDLASTPPPPGQSASCVAGDPTQVFNFVPLTSGDVDLYVKPSLFPSCFANGISHPMREQSSHRPNARSLSVPYHSHQECLHGGQSRPSTSSAPLTMSFHHSHNCSWLSAPTPPSSRSEHHT